MTKKKPRIIPPKEIFDDLNNDAGAVAELLELILRWDVDVSPRIHVRDMNGIKDHRWWHAGVIAFVQDGHSAPVTYIPANWSVCAETPLKAARMAVEACQTLTGGWAQVTAYNIRDWCHCDFKGTLQEAIAAEIKQWGDEVYLPLFAHEYKKKKDRESFVKKPNW